MNEFFQIVFCLKYCERTFTSDVIQFFQFNLGCTSITIAIRHTKMSSCQTSAQLQRQSISNTPFLHYNYFCQWVLVLWGLITSFSVRILPCLPRNSNGFIIYSASTINLLLECCVPARGAFYAMPPSPVYLCTIGYIRVVVVVVSVSFFCCFCLSCLVCCTRDMGNM